MPRFVRGDGRAAAKVSGSRGRQVTDNGDVMVMGEGKAMAGWGRRKKYDM
jgi:hypothetical protein